MRELALYARRENPRVAMIEAKSETADESAAPKEAEEEQKSSELAEVNEVEDISVEKPDMENNVTETTNKEMDDDEEKEVQSVPLPPPPPKKD